MRLKLPPTSAAIFSAFFLSVFHTQAGTLTETWIQTGSPTSAQVAKWADFQAARGTPPVQLRILLESSPASTIGELARVPGLGKIQVSANAFPTATQVEKYLPLARMGAEFVAMGGTFPTEAQVDNLNAIGFSRVLIGAAKYPSDADVAQILRLNTRVAVTFNVGRYPQFLEKFAIAKLPLDLPLQFTVDAWPRYVHMDVLNLIPQTEKRVRVMRTMLSQGSVPYVLNLKNIAELIFVSDGDVLNEQWEWISGFPLRWSTEGSVPSERALQLFRDSGRAGQPRKLVIDRDGNLTAQERNRLLASGLDVEWIHEAP